LTLWDWEMLGRRYESMTWTHSGLEFQAALVLFDIERLHNSISIVGMGKEVTWISRTYCSILKLKPADE